MQFLAGFLGRGDTEVGIGNVSDLVDVIAPCYRLIFGCHLLRHIHFGKVDNLAVRISPIASELGGDVACAHDLGQLVELCTQGGH